MTALTQQTNADGLVQRYGQETPADSASAGDGSRGSAIREYVLNFTAAEITAAAGTGFYDADASGGTTPDSFSDAAPFIPAGSVICSAYLVATVAWTGNATIDIGFETKAGAAQDADGLFNGLDVDDAADGLNTIGASPVPDGPCVRETSGTYDPDWQDGLGDHYVRVINADAGTLTAGEAKLVVQYIPYQS
jgi:hypothetical protein|tara:strand:- start:2944 stop:3519 length:576 start_codon:yes stop_codon:yes gene_type:complete